MSNFNQESVLSVHHWTDTLFSFTTTRDAELAYGEMITEKLPNDELIGEYVRNQLIYYPTVTRDPFRNRGRITDLITSGKLFADIGLATLDPAHDRVMICGSPALVTDTRALLIG